jgi:hypothetical protein
MKPPQPIALREADQDDWLMISIITENCPAGRE